MPGQVGSAGDRGERETIRVARERLHHPRVDRALQRRGIDFAPVGGPRHRVVSGPPARGQWHAATRSHDLRITDGCEHSLDVSTLVGSWSSRPRISGSVVRTT